MHEFDNTEECVAALRKKYDRILTTHLSSDAISLYDIDFKGSIALVFGSERFGVSEEMRKLADGNFIIPQLGVIRSLNISVACAVSIYEAMRQKQLAGHYRESRMPREQYDTLWQEWGFKAEDMKEEEMDK
ncbi:TrmH family RNA methyltransferase [Chitinophaga sedimenti]|uniref:TrmH family RNA methyltransferase n=1 Tax=Chitinophaga sedimenti TaxID=2033606 RepID=UPI00249EA293|nr:TrmH family RNA methyltransferase [Chitinophaga sedimenti]